MTGLGKSTLYDNEGPRDFPRRVELGENSVGWVRSEIEAWVAGRARKATKA